MWQGQAVAIKIIPHSEQANAKVSSCGLGAHCILSAKENRACSPKCSTASAVHAVLRVLLGPPTYRAALCRECSVPHRLLKLPCPSSPASHHPPAGAAGGGAVPPLQPPQRGALAALGVLRALRGPRQPREYRVPYGVRRTAMPPQAAQPDPSQVSASPCCNHCAYGCRPDLAPPPMPLALVHLLKTHHATSYC